MKRLLAALIICSAALPVSAAERPSEPETSEMVDAYVRCAAVWEWASETMRAESKPNAAEYLHNMSNGARTAAQWILSAADVVNNPDEPPKKLGHWAPYLTPKIDGELSQIRAMAELGTPPESDMKLCTDLSEGQAKIIEELRKGYTQDE